MNARYCPCLAVKFSVDIASVFDPLAPTHGRTRMNIRYVVTLSDVERSELKALVTGGKAAVRRVKRAQILLAADAGQLDEAIAAGVQAGTSTVYRTKRRFVEQGLEPALAEEPRPGKERKLSGQQEALLVATA